MPKKIYVTSSHPGKLKFVRVARPEDYSPPSPPLTPRYVPRDYYDGPRYERANISPREMENMLERERAWRAQNDDLRQQIEVLKGNCFRYQDELRGARTHVAQLQVHNRELDDQNRLLKRNSQIGGEAERQLDALKQKYAQAKEDKEELKHQNHNLRQKLKVLLDDRVAKLEAELKHALEQTLDWKTRLDRNMMLANTQEERLRRLRDNFEDVARNNDSLKLDNRRLRDDNKYYRSMFGGGP